MYTQVGVGGFPVHIVPQEAIWSFVYVTVQDGKWPFESLFMVN